LEQTDAAPVERADDGNDQRDAVHDHHVRNLSFPKGYGGYRLDLHKFGCNAPAAETAPAAAKTERECFRPIIVWRGDEAFMCRGEAFFWKKSRYCAEKFRHPPCKVKRNMVYYIIYEHLRADHARCFAGVLLPIRIEKN
jgi:hypothetical protein